MAFGSQLASPDPLPAPPMLESLLFESPWRLAGALLIAGVLLFFILNRSGRARHALIGALAALVLAAIVVITSFAVTTQRERLVANTERFVDAVAQADTNAAEQIIAPEIQVRFGGAIVSDMDRAWLMSAIRSFNGRLSLREHSIKTNNAVIDRPGRGRTMLEISVVAEQWPVPNRSWWQIDWAQDAQGDWSLVALDCLQLAGQDADANIADRVNRNTR